MLQPEELKRYHGAQFALFSNPPFERELCRLAEGAYMKWQGRRGSENVIDRTGKGGRRGKGALLGGGGLGTVALVVLLYLLGVSPGEIFGLLSDGGNSKPSVTRTADPSTQAQKDFLSVVLADTEEVWTEIFKQNGQEYVEPRLVLFEGSVNSACGFSSAAVGPFYCPGDENLYLDLSFFDQLSRDLNAPGDFAQAYVIGHEIGHHVQNLNGVLSKVQLRKRELSKKEANALQVRVELQADYYAGVWAHHAQRRFNILEPGDIDEALQAASSIGDDTLQKRSKGYVVPDAFTHGTSEQRVRWFRRGFERGDLAGGDTFSANNL
jgi:predicted metalloprotease